MFELRLKETISLDTLMVFLFKAKHTMNVKWVLLKQYNNAIHPIKINLIPNQEIKHLGFVINSVKMTVTLTDNIKYCLRDMMSDILSSHSSIIRHIAKLMGKLVSTFPASAYGPLYYRNIEYNKTHALTINQGNYNVHMTYLMGQKMTHIGS